MTRRAAEKSRLEVIQNGPLTSKRPNLRRPERLCAASALPIEDVS
jgi:hypothetical protein